MKIPVSEFSIAGFQMLNRQIYGKTNARNYEKSDMVTRLQRYSTLVLKAVRKRDTESVAFDLAMAFSWATALANALHIDLDAEVWEKFPGVCCYCGYKPCGCKVRPKNRLELDPQKASRPQSLRDSQLSFAKIYPNNILLHSAAHLTEEVDELDEAITQYRGTHDEKIFDEIKLELVDVIANIFAVANMLCIDVAHEMEVAFREGCPKCSSFNCECGFVTANTTVLRA